MSQPKLVLIVGCFGLASNILGLVLFHDHSHGHDNHSHGSEQDIQDQTSIAERGQNTSVEGEPTVVSSERGNIADVLPQNVVGNWSRPATNVEATNMSEPQGFKRSEDSATTFADSSPHSRRRKTSSASTGNRYTHHRSRRSGSHTRYSSMGEAPVHLHPASFRNEIIAAARLEEIDSAPATESEGESTDDGKQATESEPLLSKTRKHNYVSGHNGQIDHTKRGSSLDLGHTSHKHRNPKSMEDSHGHSHGDLNIRGIFLHVMGDALGNIGVIATALVIWLTDYSWRFYFDPFISLVITVIILLSAIPLCRAASRILLQAVPAGLEIDDIKEDIESLKGVVSCHHVHVWQLSDTKLVASLHVQLGFDFEGAGKKEYMRLAKEVRTCLHEYGIHSSTIQPEFCLDEAHNHGASAYDSGNDQVVRNRPQDACLLDCDDSCLGATCCAPDTATNNSRASSTGRGN